MNWTGTLRTSFQLHGPVHFSIGLDGYPKVGETNRFLEGLNGKSVIVTIEEVPAA